MNLLDVRGEPEPGVEHLHANIALQVSLEVSVHLVLKFNWLIRIWSLVTCYEIFQGGGGDIRDKF